MLPILNSLTQSRDMVMTFKGYNHTSVIDDGEWYDMTNLSSDEYPTLSPRKKRKYIKGIDETLKCQVSCDSSLVSVARGTFISAVDAAVGTYQFVKSGSDWTLNGTVITPSDYGLSWTTEPSSSFNVIVSKTLNGMIGYQAVTGTTDFWHVRGDVLLSNPLGGSNGYTLKYNQGERTIVPMGSYLTIFPDKMYYNTSNTTDKGDMEYDVTYTGIGRFTPCKIDGTTFTVDYTGTTDPTTTSTVSNGEIWLDTANNVYKQYTSTTMTWVVMTTYICVSAPSGSTFPSNLQEGTTVTVYDIDTTGVATQTAEEIEALDGQTFVVQKATTSYFVIIGTLTGIGQVPSFKVKSKLPLMDFVIECNNRLWGCRYGLNSAGEYVNEIYASKLGDFKTWYCFQGISTDSYAVSLGVPGAFTGAISYGGYPIFFKEDCLIKIYGDYPSNFQVQTTPVKGVQSGSYKSLAIINNVLYYKSINGVCYYDGSLPYEMSDIFGGEKYTSAISGVYKNKLYISMLNSSSNAVLFVYDTKKKLWHKEDSTRFSHCCQRSDDLCFSIDGETNQYIHCIERWGNTESDDVEWMATSGIMGLSSPDHKYVNKISIRMQLPQGSTCCVYLAYDSDTEGLPELASFSGSSTRTFTVVIRPKRCDHFQLVLTGTGDCKIFSITKTTTAGSDER